MRLSDEKLKEILHDWIKAETHGLVYSCYTMAISNNVPRSTLYNAIRRRGARVLSDEQYALILKYLARNKWSTSKRLDTKADCVNSKEMLTNAISAKRKQLCDEIDTAFSNILSTAKFKKRGTIMVIDECKFQHMYRVCNKLKTLSTVYPDWSEADV